MARYTGPVCRLCRRIGEELGLKGERCLTGKCAIKRRNMPPGTHTPRRRKMSERGLQLREKQKARYIFGTLERQFHKTFVEAERRPGMTGENLLRLLEMRLDNIVYKLGFASTRNQGRQLVAHGHITINGRKTDIPSAAVKVGNVISWTPQSVNSEFYKDAQDRAQSTAAPGWLSLDPDNMVGRVTRVPSREEMEARINESVITEYYSR